MLNLFHLNPSVTHLNHGSFGACPKTVIASYQQWQIELEKEPVQFFIKKGIDAMQESKHVLSAFIGAKADNFVFTPNPSTAFNTVFRSLPLQAGDEVLTTNLEYGAMDKTWQFISRKKGINYIRQEINLPIVDKETILNEFFVGLSPKTKAIFISHITSSTGLILPVEEICKKAKSLGLFTIVDGAHVPGHIDINLDSSPFDFYTGALHKWLLAPKGCSFLYVKPELQSMIDPLIVSWGYDADIPDKSQFLAYLEYSGTNDYAAYLTLPAIHDFWTKYDWKKQMKKAQIDFFTTLPSFFSLLNSKAISPIHTNFLGHLCSIPIQTPNPEQLKNTLYDDYHIEIPITELGKQNFLRISYQVYNNLNDLDKLHNALIDLQKKDMINGVDLS